MSLYFNVHGLYTATCGGPTMMENPGVSIVFPFFRDHLGEYTGQR